jgi:hypothetical protein
MTSSLFAISRLDPVRDETGIELEHMIGSIQIFLDHPPASLTEQERREYMERYGADLAALKRVKELRRVLFRRPGPAR